MQLGVSLKQLIDILNERFGTDFVTDDVTGMNGYPPVGRLPPDDRLAAIQELK